jgi:hypothetical protein
MLAAVTAAKVGLSRGGRRTADAMRARRPSCFEGFPAAPPRAFACVERADAAERDEAVDRDAGDRRAAAAGDWPVEERAPDPERPDTVRPEAVRPDAVRPEAVRPDAVRPDVEGRRDPDRVGTVRLDTEESPDDVERPAADLPAAGRAPDVRLAPLEARPATRRPGPCPERSDPAVVGRLRSAGTAAPVGRSGWTRSGAVAWVRVASGPVEIPAQPDVDRCAAAARREPPSEAGRRPELGAIGTAADSARFGGVNEAAESTDRRALCLGGALCLAE